MSDDRVPIRGIGPDSRDKSVGPASATRRAGSGFGECGPPASFRSGGVLQIGTRLPDHRFGFHLDPVLVSDEIGPDQRVGGPD